MTLPYTAFLGSFDLHDGVHYELSMESLMALEAAPPQEPIMVPMADRAPAYIRSQPVAEDITLNFFFLQRIYQDRRADYDALVAVLRNGEDQIDLTWSAGDGVVKTISLLVQTVTPNAFFSRASVTTIVADPYAVAA